MSLFPNQASAKLNLSFNIRNVILVIGTGLIVCLPLYVYGVSFVGDLPHHYRTAIGFYESILNGNFYPSWHPSTNGGYGDASVRFYPPALYFLLCAARLISGDWFLAGLITSVLLTTIGALGMYLWARSFTGHYYALAAGVLFLLSPFHANEMYQAGMYGQYGAGNLLPFVFAFVERIIRGGRSYNIAGLAFAYGLVILFHVPLAVLGSISVAIYALIRLIQTFNVAAIYRLVAGIALGIGLSCFYWFPVMQELRWKSPSGTGQGAWFNYKNNSQFPWRWMTISSACLSLLVTMSLPELASMWHSRWRPLSLALIGLVTIALSFTILQLIRGAPLHKRAAFDQEVDAQRGSATNQDFLPVWALGTPRAMSLPVEAGNRQVTIADWSGERKVFAVEPGPETVARLKTYYYPYWIASANGKRLNTNPADDGALLVTVPPEKSMIEVTFTEPSSTHVAAGVSICALFVIIWLIFLPNPSGQPLNLRGVSKLMKRL